MSMCKIFINIININSQMFEELETADVTLAYDDERNQAHKCIHVTG